MKKASEKTNVMRILEQSGISYIPHDYTASGVISGLEVASVLQQDPDRVFKTLVASGASGAHYVFVIPVSQELNLKKAAAAVGEKSVHMIPQKELLPLTGYIHGGCSPIGMKKPFPTAFDFTAELFDTICFSAGRIGYQVECSFSELASRFPFSSEDLT